jgi:hypothetical protein
MNEKEIQDRLYVWLEKKRHNLITPNVFLYHPRESDLISVTKAGMATEYEIKISKSDLTAEFKKKRVKHAIFSAYSAYGPNYFYFVFPAYLWEKIDTELPSYAGVIVVDELSLKVSKKAKRMHSLPLLNTKVEYLQRGLMLRYWRERLNKE